MLKGKQRVARRATKRPRLRLKKVPAARLRVRVRAVSSAGVLSKPRAVRVPRR